jgi:Domain of unknown function (DUF4270)
MMLSFQSPFQKLSGFIFYASFLLSFNACQEPIAVGSDLLEGDLRIDVGFIDSLKLSSYTIPGERVITYRSGVNSRTYLLGQLSDPVFGKLNAEVYLKNYLNASLPNFTGAVLDSVVLALQYDSLGTYGGNNASFKVDVFQLIDPLPIKDTIYSDVNIPSSSTPIGSKTLVVAAKDSITIKDHVTGKNVRQAAHLRIKLDSTWGAALINNVDANKADSTFSKYIKGLHIKAAPISGSGIFGLNFSDAVLGTTSPINKLIVYYHKSPKDSTLQTYLYPIQGITVNKYSLDRVGTVAQDLIDNKLKGNEYTLLQAAGGIKTIVTFDNLAPLADKLISKVELDIFVGGLPNQNTSISPPVQLVANRYNSDGKLELIPDILQLSSVGQNFGPVFGGNLDNKQSVKKYTLNITNHVKNIIEKPTTYRPELVLGILTESESASQVVLYGGKHSAFPMKMRVTYVKK